MGYQLIAKKKKKKIEKKKKKKEKIYLRYGAPLARFQRAGRCC